MRVTIPYGLVVRIPGFHPGGPGSIPGVGTFNIFFEKKEKRKPYHSHNSEFEKMENYFIVIQTSPSIKKKFLINSYYVAPGPKQDT